MRLKTLVVQSEERILWAARDTRKGVENGIEYKREIKRTEFTNGQKEYYTVSSCNKLLRILELKSTGFG